MAKHFPPLGGWWAPKELPWYAKKRPFWHQASGIPTASLRAVDEQHPMDGPWWTTHRMGIHMGVNPKMVGETPTNPWVFLLTYDHFGVWNGGYHHLRKHPHRMVRVALLIRFMDQILHHAVDIPHSSASYEFLAKGLYIKNASRIGCLTESVFFQTYPQDPYVLDIFSYI